MQMGGQLNATRPLATCVLFGDDVYDLAVAAHAVACEVADGCSAQLGQPGCGGAGRKASWLGNDHPWLLGR